MNSSRITKNCLFCGAEFGADLPRSRMLAQKFCSSACQNKHRYRDNRVEVLCAGCGKTISIKKSRESLYLEHYCSRACMASDYSRRMLSEQNPNHGHDWPMERRISLSMKKNPRPEFNGFISSERKLMMSSQQYADWRMAVFKRDDFTCQRCGKPSDKDLEAHHVKPVRTHKNLAFDVDNGLTLCADCHCEVDAHRFRFKAKT